MVKSQTQVKGEVRPAETARERAEYWLVWILVKTLGGLPRGTARAIGAGIGVIAFGILKRLRETGLRNLALAYPAWPPEQR